MKHNFYPVIHVKSVAHAYENAGIAFENGADGVFLINMGDTTHEILKEAVFYLHNLTMPYRHKFVIGVNYLCNLNLLSSDDIPSPTTMLWSDILKGYENSTFRTSKCSFYAPFAFKYQKQPSFREWAEQLSNVDKVADVICTSGDGTGIPPTLSKLQNMRMYTKKPIAIASGISSENVRQFKPYVRDFLVGTSIGYHNLIPLEVKRLADIIHE